MSYTYHTIQTKTGKEPILSQIKEYPVILTGKRLPGGKLRRARFVTIIIAGS